MEEIDRKCEVLRYEETCHWEVIFFFFFLVCRARGFKIEFLKRSLNSERFKLIRIPGYWFASFRTPNPSGSRRIYVLKGFLRIFILVPFYDISILSSRLKTSLEHDNRNKVDARVEDGETVHNGIRYYP